MKRSEARNKVRTECRWPTLEYRLSDEDCDRIIEALDAVPRLSRRRRALGVFWKHVHFHVWWFKRGLATGWHL